MIVGCSGKTLLNIVRTYDAHFLMLRITYKLTSFWEVGKDYVVA